jgi:hypothetical protein
MNLCCVEIKQQNCRPRCSLQAGESVLVLYRLQEHEEVRFTEDENWLTRLLHHSSSLALLIKERVLFKVRIRGNTLFLMMS